MVCGRVADKTPATPHSSKLVTMIEHQAYAMKLVPACLLALQFFPASISGQNNLADNAISSGSGANGVLLIEIAGRGKAEYHVWRYELRPHAGSLRIISDELAKPGSQVYKEESPSSVESQECGMDLTRQLNSPNETYTAKCIPSNGSWTWGNAVQLTEAKKSGILYHWNLKGRYVRRLAWRPDSGALAILNVSERSSRDPAGIFSALSGHPIPHETFYIDIIDVSTRKTVEYLIRDNVLYGEAEIIGWSE